LDELIPKCDIITFHVPLTKEGPDATRHTVGREFIAATRPEAVILNSSRGAVIEPVALREAVGADMAAAGRGPIPGRGFIIDTWNGEPDLDREVLERVLLGTSHIAGYSAQGKATATSMIVNALAGEFGLPLSHENTLDWYPEGALRSEPRDIRWDEMRRTMPRYFDIAAESATLKAAPEQFEAMRDNYNYRTEYF
jgi:erythronate-4-phosphate dehydrogenase